MNIPRITPRFVYIFKPLNGVVNGAKPCLFLERDTTLEGEEWEGALAITVEYPGGPSESSWSGRGCITRLSEDKMVVLWISVSIPACERSSRHH